MHALQRIRNGLKAVLAGGCRFVHGLHLQLNLAGLRGHITQLFIDLADRGATFFNGIREALNTCNHHFGFALNLTDNNLYFTRGA